MPIEVDCPHCGERHDVPFTHAGRVQPCAGCGKSMRIPTPRAMVSAKTKSERTQIITPNDLFEMAYERVAARFSWIISKPVRIIASVLLLVVGGLGIAGAKWALRESGKAQPVPVKPHDPEPWEGVGMTDSNDRVRVTAESAKSDRVMVRSHDGKRIFKSVDAFLIVALKIDNLSPDHELNYSGWEARSAPDDQKATMKDDQGKSVPQFDGVEEIAGQMKSGSVPPGGSIKELLVFQIPHSYAEYLKLALPAKACGGSGELRIKIPRTPSGD